MLVALDIGHGSSDSGAINGDLIEKNINLNVGLKVKELLNHNGIGVVITREVDIPLSPSKRLEIINNSNADIGVSIHHNAGGGDGFEIYHSIIGGEGKVLAEILEKEFSKLNNKRKVGFIRSASDPNKDKFYIIRKTTIPMILTELAFLDSVDRDIIDTIQKQHQEAYAIAKSVCKYFNIKFTDPVELYKDLNLFKFVSKEEIRFAKSNKIMEGDPSGYFRPQDKLTREEMLKVALNIIKYNEVR